VRAAEQIIIVH